MKCCNCGSELEPEDNYFVEEIYPDLYWHCGCGQKYEVDHYCGEERCYEDLYPLEVNNE